MSAISSSSSPTSPPLNLGHADSQITSNESPQSVKPLIQQIAFSCLVIKSDVLQVNPGRLVRKTQQVHSPKVAAAAAAVAKSIGKFSPWKASTPLSKACSQAVKAPESGWEARTPQSILKGNIAVTFEETYDPIQSAKELIEEIDSLPEGIICVDEINQKMLKTMKMAAKAILHTFNGKVPDKFKVEVLMLGHSLRESLKKLENVVRAIAQAALQNEPALAAADNEAPLPPDFERLLPPPPAPPFPGRVIPRDPEAEWYKNKAKSLSCPYNPSLSAFAEKIKEFTHEELKTLKAIIDTDHRPDDIADKVWDAYQPCKESIRAFLNQKGGFKTAIEKRMKEIEIYSHLNPIFIKRHNPNTSNLVNRRPFGSPSRQKNDLLRDLRNRFARHQYPKEYVSPRDARRK